MPLKYSEIASTAKKSSRHLDCQASQLMVVLCKYNSQTYFSSTLSPQRLPWIILSNGTVRIRPPTGFRRRQEQCLGIRWNLKAVERCRRPANFPNSTDCTRCCNRISPTPENFPSKPKYSASGNRCHHLYGTLQLLLEPLWQELLVHVRKVNKISIHIAQF